MSVIKIFEHICTLPRCSYKSEKIREFIEDEGKKAGYLVQSDQANNILVSHKNSKVTLQAHSDMVCIGEYEDMQLETKDGVMHAHNSTLGADNGMAIAMMIALIRERAEVDCLFTADEEVGLVGARALALEIKTPYLLNLDSEDEGLVTLGCAGGVDIVATKEIVYTPCEDQIYSVVCEGYEGGHSGVDIHLNIKNAIKELALKIDKPDIKILSIEGGERRNSIAKHAQAMISSSSALEFEKVDIEAPMVMERSQELIELLNNFSHGVRAFNKELNIVQSSINLAKISSDNAQVKIELTARSMRKKELDMILKESCEYFENYGFSLSHSDYYEPWEIENSAFSELVIKAAKGIYESVEVSAIHAGLECGILKQKSKDVLMASIGPTITYPHSTRESVDLASVERTFSWVKNILNLV